MTAYTEDTLVQQTTAEYLRNELGWESVYAYNQEIFGPDGTLGRASDREVVLTRYLRGKLEELNPGLSGDAYWDAVRQIVETSASQTTLATNREKYALLKDGVQVSFRNDQGELKKERLRVFNFEEPEKNHFLCVRELWVRGDLYRRRADIVGFVNGLPLLFIECKNVHKDLRLAYDGNFRDYIDDKVVPHLFHHNAFVVLGNGIEAKIGSISSKFGHFSEWKRLEEEEPGVVDMETLLKGVCDKRNLMDLFENFIVFDDSSGRPAKILSRNHQFLGVNRALDAVESRQARQGKLGVFWHTQGSGKSYSMVFFTRKVHRKLGGNFTFVICTDRDDLDTQIYKTFAGPGDGGRGGDGGEITAPAKPEEELLADLAEAVALVRSFLKGRDASLDDIIEKIGFARNASILAVKEAANENDETRKRFEVICREVFKKFKACINLRGVNAHRKEYDAVNIVYRSLQQDRERADISDIIWQLHKVVDQAIETQSGRVKEQAPYNIAAIDFDRLRKEFERSPAKKTTVQNLKQAIERRLKRLLEQNPLRTDFQKYYEEIVAEYNREKDRLTIERTFEALLKLVQELDEEENRAMREGLDEESLAIFDLLRKPELTAAEVKRIKEVAVELLKTLKEEKLKIDHWRDKESSRDAVRIAIKDFLWSEETGLPVDSYSEDDVNTKTEDVFRHVYRVYPTVPSPYYAEVMV